jgi:hypothetical protein
MKRLQFIPLLVFLTLLSSCGRTPASGAGTATNAPGKDFTTKDGSTVRLGAFIIDNTNVPLTNVQVK